MYRAELVQREQQDDNISEYVLEYTCIFKRFTKLLQLFKLLQLLQLLQLPQLLHHIVYRRQSSVWLLIKIFRQTPVKAPEPQIKQTKRNILKVLYKLFHSSVESYSVGTVTPHSRQETGLASKCSAADKTLGRIPSKLLNKVLYPPWVPSETTLLFAAAETTQRKQPEKSSGGVGAFFWILHA